MINTLDYLAYDPIRRAMEEQRFMLMDELHWKQELAELKRANKKLDKKNAALQSESAALQKQLEEYMLRYGKINFNSN